VISPSKKEDRKRKKVPKIPPKLQTRNFGRCRIEDVCLKTEYTLDFRKIS